MKIGHKSASHSPSGCSFDDASSCGGPVRWKTNKHKIIIIMLTRFDIIVDSVWPSGRAALGDDINKANNNRNNKIKNSLNVLFR